MWPEVTRAVAARVLFVLVQLGCSDTTVSSDADDAHDARGSDVCTQVSDAAIDALDALGHVLSETDEGARGGTGNERFGDGGVAYVDCRIVDVAPRTGERSLPSPELSARFALGRQPLDGPWAIAPRGEGVGIAWGEASGSEAGSISVDILVAVVEVGAAPSSEPIVVLQAVEGLLDLSMVGTPEGFELVVFRSEPRGLVLDLVVLDRHGQLLGLRSEVASIPSDARVSRVVQTKCGWAFAYEADGVLSMMRFAPDGDLIQIDSLERRSVNLVRLASSTRGLYLVTTSYGETELLAAYDACGSVRPRFRMGRNFHPEGGALAADDADVWFASRTDLATLVVDRLDDANDACIRYFVRVRALLQDGSFARVGGGYYLGLRLVADLWQSEGVGLLFVGDGGSVDGPWLVGTKGSPAVDGLDVGMPQLAAVGGIVAIVWPDYETSQLSLRWLRPRCGWATCP